MPLSPQITITPVPIVTKNFDISAVSYTSSTATYTATGHTFAVGDTVLVSDLVPAGYNGTFTVTAIATNTFTVANTTNAAVTDAAGNAFWVDTTEYSYENVGTTFLTTNTDLLDDAVNPALAYALQAQADATAAQASATTAYNTAVAANTAASTAQSTADGKNKVTYSTATPGSTANTLGDIWYQYGTSSPNVGRIIAQYTGNGGTSWTQTSISGLVVANIDAGSITTGTLSVALGITTGTGTFTVNAVTGALFADSATIKGQINATSGYFGTSTNGYSISSVGLTGIGSGAITGGIIQTSTGSNSVSLVGSSNSLTFKNSGSNVGHILPLSSNGVLMHYGASADGSGGTFPQMYVGSSNVSMFASTGNGIGVSASSGINLAASTGNINLNSQTNYSGVATGSGTSMVLVSTGSRIAIVTSSERFKQEIQYVSTTGWLDKVLAMKPITYKTDVDFTTKGEPNEIQYGFLAEDIYDLGGGLEKTVILDPLGDPFSLSYDRLTVFLMLAIKELKAKLDALEGK